MEIDRKLNLVVPVEREDGTVCYVHAAPISRQVFKDNYMVIAKTFAAIYSEGLHVVAGPRVAGMMLRDVAKNLGLADRIEMSLMAEVRRLANVCVAGPRGWDMIPLEEAMAKGILTPDDADEIEGVLCFFTVASSMHSKREAPAILSTVAGLWSGQITSSTVTEYITSLKTSIPAVPIGESQTVSLSSIPH